MSRKLLVYVASVRDDQLLDDGRHPATLEIKGDVIPLRPVVLCQIDNDQAVEDGKGKLIKGIDKIVAATRDPVQQKPTNDPKILRAREREAQGQ